MRSLNAGILTSRLQRRFSEWATERRGTTAVEFALIAAPFFFIIFGLLEICLIFIMSTVLENAVSDSAREIRTGQAQEAGFSMVEYRKSVCDSLFGLMGCDSNLHVDVKRLDSFSAANLTSPLDSDGNFDDGDFDFQPGSANDIVAVRVYYEWSLVTPILSAPLANMANGKHLIQAATVFRNEPFGD
ncbi:TadE-like protein [Hyphomonas adhaerens MHS-3]|uniref:TadE-like protein n=1 Tax=Hyphomonas adhaerens MHS-3 TaxID=1280949 RepID=A0A069E386_9PROT|nr:TadE/TadG family type IV pilus assembly protein [Hyphomonas adhaerens]KCZ84428.1 TadE-like protein [Hyphomonas adhaerens MHS-3]